MRRTVAGVMALTGTAFLVACGGSDTAMGPDDHQPPVGDAAAGKETFQVACATCHASRDGFDIAYFDFTPGDIIRRAVAHVDTARARDIVAYIQSLPVVHHNRNARLFQPGGTVVQDDQTFWRDLFGTDGWPADLTADEIRALDLRDVPIPLPLPVWSSEPDASDWMPEDPLPEQTLMSHGGALKNALAAYYTSRTDASLLAAIAAFQESSGRGSGDRTYVCAGGVGTYAHPDACLEARRWMSSLAALHYLRKGALRDIPLAVAQLWWETGEAGVTVHFFGSGMKRTSVAAWLYLASMFSPDGFLEPGSILAEDAGYMGQFLQGAGLTHLATLVTLRRMVSEGAIHAARPEQAYWDMRLAASRAPPSMTADVLAFGLEYLRHQQEQGRYPPGERIALVQDMLDRTWEDYQTLVSRGVAMPSATVRPLLDQVEAGLESRTAAER